MLIIYRVEFCMSDSGDLTWKVPRGAVAEPYFAQSFDLYEVMYVF